MSVIETGKIDIVATRPGSRLVKLVVADHLPWDDSDGHARLLQDKINTYIAFVESGQLARLKEPKLPESPEVHIEVVLQHAPTSRAKEFLRGIDGFLRGIGLGFEWRVEEGAADS